MESPYFNVIFQQGSSSQNVQNPLFHVSALFIKQKVALGEVTMLIRYTSVLMQNEFYHRIRVS